MKVLQPESLRTAITQDLWDLLILPGRDEDCTWSPEQLPEQFAYEAVSLALVQQVSKPQLF